MMDFRIRLKWKKHWNMFPWSKRSTTIFFLSQAWRTYHQNIFFYLTKQVHVSIYLIRSLIGVDFVFLPQFIQTKIKTVKHVFRNIKSRSTTFFSYHETCFSFLQNRSQEQQHYFNTPFQLSLPPSHLATEVLSDAPESADRHEFSVEHH